jgi:hypothetical protein
MRLPAASRTLHGYESANPQRPSAMLGWSGLQQHAVFARGSRARLTFTVHALSKCSCRTAGGRRGCEPGRSAFNRIRVPGS